MATSTQNVNMKGEAFFAFFVKKYWIQFLYLKKIDLFVNYFVNIHGHEIDMIIEAPDPDLNYSIYIEYNFFQN